MYGKIIKSRLCRGLRHHLTPHRITMKILNILVFLQILRKKTPAISANSLNFAILQLRFLIKISEFFSSFPAIPPPPIAAGYLIYSYFSHTASKIISNKFCLFLKFSQFFFIFIIIWMQYFGNIRKFCDLKLPEAAKTWIIWKSNWTFIIPVS